MKRRFVPVLVLSALALTACGQPLHAGAAAVVGNSRIPTSQLRVLVDRGLALPQAASLASDRPAFERQVLTRLILHALLGRLAAADHVVVTDQEVDADFARIIAQVGSKKALDASAAQNGVAPQDERAIISDDVVQTQLQDALTASVVVSDAQLRAAYQQNIAQYDQVHAAHILVPAADKTLADQIAAEVRADPSQFAALAAKYSIDTGSKNSGGDLGFAGRGQFVKPFEAAIFNGKPGTIVGPIRTQFGWHIIDIIARRTTTFDQAKADLRRQLLQTTRQSMLHDALVSIGSRVGVSVSPRFGQWNAAALAVAAATSSGGLSTPASATPSPSPTVPGGGAPPSGQ